MTNLFWEYKTIVCDICKERPMKTMIQVSPGVWKGVCEECNIKKEDKSGVENERKG
jgi:hypothetical protein